MAVATRQHELLRPPARWGPRPGAAMKAPGATLEQVLASRPTADYDTRYGAVTGPWTTGMFVTAVYRTAKPN